MTCAHTIIHTVHLLKLPNSQERLLTKRRLVLKNMQHNSFEQVTQGTRSYIARQYPFYFGMGLGHEGKWAGQDEWDVDGFPGLVGPRFSEHPQRCFYGFWAELMGEVNGERPEGK